MEKETTNGIMANIIQANGSSIKWMVEALLEIPMEKNSPENSLMINILGLEIV